VGGRKEGRLKKKKTENDVNRKENKKERKKERRKKGIEQLYRKKETKYCNNIAKLMKCVCVCV